LNKITFPLKPGMKGTKVGDLQVALQLLLDRGVILANGDGARRELSAALQRERAKQTYGSATRKLVIIFQKERHIAPSGSVDEATANSINRFLDELSGPAEEQSEFVVKGAVHLSDGSPAVGVMVSAFDRDLRSEQLLGRQQTNEKGSYAIQYSAARFRKREKGSADLVVKAFATDGSLLAASSVLFNAPSHAELDVIIPAEMRQPPSLFEKLGQALTPLLGKLPVADLEENARHQDVTFLSGETGFEKSLLARFIMAHKLAQLGVEGEFWFALLGGSFFQYVEDQSLKDQQVGVLDSLSSLDAASVRKALISGFNRKDIPEPLREKVADWVEAFLEFIARQSVNGATKPKFVKLILEHAGITNAKKQEKFARLFNEHKALTPNLLKTLERDKSFKKSEIADLRTSFQLVELTRSDFSVVKAIKDEFEVRQPEKIRLLAKKSEAEWVKLVKEKRAAGDITLPIEVGEVAGRAKLSEAEVYGKMLQRHFQEAFPTTAFAGGLERALQNGGSHGLRHAEALGKFLERHENFEFLNTPVDDFLKHSIHPDFQTLARDENFRLEVKAVQRVFKLAPSFKSTDTLLADDLHSAQKIYRLGETEFVRRYAGRGAFTAESARLA
jgi:peptidoglycan hydrolase-like protein with peptidoglycan-binding domain